MEEITTTIEAPDIALDSTLPPPFIRNYYRDEEERIYRLDHDLSDEDLALLDLILRCNKADKGKPIEERGPIKVYISTYGGDVTTLWTLIQAIQTSKTPVWTINISFAYSAGAELLTAGHKRFALKGTQTMFHRGSCFFGGEQGVVESTKKHFDGIEKKLTDFLMSHTRIDPKFYKKKASSDIYMDEDEALKNGVIDVVVDDFDILF
jgi:ATP-dependent Clp protease protease subunit